MLKISGGSGAEQEQGWGCEGGRRGDHHWFCPDSDAADPRSLFGIHRACFGRADSHISASILQEDAVAGSSRSTNQRPVRQTRSGVRQERSWLLGSRAEPSRAAGVFKELRVS